jgi:hypothetical protein
VSNGKQWDLTSTHSLEGACEWIRKGSGALFVVAVRAGAVPDADGRFTDDSAIAVDPAMPIKDLLPRLELEVAALTVALMKQRDPERKNHDRLSAQKQTQR